MSMAPTSAHEQARAEAQQDQVATFVVTGADVTAARTMLEASAWNMDAAVNAFEHGAPAPTAAMDTRWRASRGREPQPEPAAEPEPAPAPVSMVP